MTKVQLEKSILKYAEQGLKRRAIARKMGISRYKVDRILNSLEKPDGPQKAGLDLLKAFHDDITKWFCTDSLPAKIIHDRLKQQGVGVSYSTTCRYLKTLNKPEVYVPIITSPGEECQVDFGYLGVFKKDNKKVKVWVFNMVLSYSRYAFYKIATDQSTATFLNCHAEAFEFFKGVPLSIKIDNLGAAVFEADFFEPTFQKKYLDFLDHYDTTAVTARICRGSDKGKVEAGIKYVKGLFLKSIMHSDFNRLADDLANWVRTECNTRVHGTTRKIPLDEYNLIEKSTLRALPNERFRSIEYEERKVNSYGHVYYKKNYYSVPSQYSGDTVQIESNGILLKIYSHDKLVTIHAIQQGEGNFKSEDKHRPFHKQANSELFYIDQAEQVGAGRLLQLMQAERPFHWKNMMKGIFALEKVYPIGTLVRACARTVESGQHTYKRVRQYCEKIASEPRETKAITGVNGYYHDLSVYDQLLR